MGEHEHPTSALCDMNHSASAQESTGSRMLDGVARQLGAHGTQLLRRRLQRRAVQRAAGAGADPLADDKIHSAAERGVAGSGGEVPHRARMEEAFGTSFDSVRAHTDNAASVANRQMNAEAYTFGESVAFGTTSPSLGLVAHELAHVVQQRAGAGPAGGVGHEGDAFEQEAHAAAAQVESGGRTDMARRYGAQPAQGVLQRKAVQRYESGEHAMLGCGADYPFVGGAELTLPNGAVVYSGELVAFPDFYADLQQIARVPRQESEALAGFCRLEALWMQARRLARQANGSGPAHDEHLAPGSAPDAPAPAAGQHSPGVSARDGDRRRLEVFPEIQGDADIWGHKVHNKTLLQWRQQLNDQFSAAWAFFGITFSPDKEPPGNYIAMVATLGRRRFRENNDSLYDKAKDPAGLGGDYLDLAGQNVSHFTVDNWENWQEHHRQACAEHKGATSESQKSMALARDMMGSHYLTDRFAAGHTVNKEELMTYATRMMLTAAGQDPSKREGEVTHEALKSLLDKALETCFDDPAVAQKWDEGVNLAFDRHLISAGEKRLLQGLPKTNGPNGIAICGQVRDVIMDMPWRNVSGQAQLGADSRSYGPGSQAQGKGDYHLGVGNLAMLQVHNALNAIGFTVKNSLGRTWRMQGDAHLTNDTQEIAHAAVEASQQQVRSGSDDPAAIRKHMPIEGYIDPQWIRDYFQSGGALFDDGRITALCQLVDGKKIPLGLSREDGVNPLLTDLCHRLMEIIFLAPKDNQGQVQDPSGTGLNVSMLKAFLIQNLPDMVSLSYAATSAADLPQAALESYAPAAAAGEGTEPKLLPRAANDFRWEGDRVHFNLNVTGCAPGEYTLGVSVRDRDWGYDFTEAGQADGRGVSDPNRGALGSALSSQGKKNEDSETDQASIKVRVPSDPGGQPGAPRESKYVEASYQLPERGTAGAVWDFFTGDDRYVMIYADDGRVMCIGRSGSRTDSDVALSNPHPTAELPVVTGPEEQRTRPGPTVSGIAGGSFQWSGSSVLFRVSAATAAPGSTVTVYIKQFNKDWGFDYDAAGGYLGNSLPGGRDSQIGGVRAVSVKLTGVESETIVFPVAEDNPGDTYIVVFRQPGCTGADALGRSDTQGNNQGAALARSAPPNPAKGVSDFSWSGARLRFRVDPPGAGQVWLKWFDKDMGFDYDEGGRLLSGARDEDEQVGGLQTIAVQSNGVAEAVATGDANDPGDTYAIVYAEPECQTPLGRSNVQP